MTFVKWSYACSHGRRYEQIKTAFADLSSESTTSSIPVEFTNAPNRTLTSHFCIPHHHVAYKHVFMSVVSFPHAAEEGSKYAWMHYTECWNKLHMWRLEQYSKVVYLDADMIVLRNLDHLFKLEDGFWAACDCYHGRDAEEEHARCPHYQAADGVQGGAYFNAGKGL